MDKYQGRERRVTNRDHITWNPEDMLEISLDKPDDFLKIQETLGRIGLADEEHKVLHPTCYILHKKLKYYIVSIKELQALNGKAVNMSSTDIERRNAIATLLQQWDLCCIADSSKIAYKCPVSKIKILPYKEKSSWTVEHEYSFKKKTHLLH